MTTNKTSTHWKVLITTIIILIVAGIIAYVLWVDTESTPAPVVTPVIMPQPTSTPQASTTTAAFTVPSDWERTLLHLQILHFKLRQILQLRLSTTASNF